MIRCPSSPLCAPLSLLYLYFPPFSEKLDDCTRMSTVCVYSCLLRGAGLSSEQHLDLFGLRFMPSFS